MREIEEDKPPSKTTDSKGTGSNIRRDRIDSRYVHRIQVWLPGNIGGLAVHGITCLDSLHIN